jgi:mRNA interferase RelE/StbE
MRLAISARARREIRRLPSEIRERAVAAVLALADDPRPPGCRLLHDWRPPTWRIRIADWRVLYQIRDEVGLVRVIGVRHRSRAY